MMRRWTFGDGNSSREKNPVHVYQQKGRYKVTLEVTDSAGNVTSSASMPPTYIVVLPLLDIGDQYLVCTQSDPDGKVTLLNKAVYPYDTASSLRRYTWSTGDTSASINVGPGRYTVNYEACGQTLVDSAAVFASADTTGLRILKVGNWDYGNISLDLGVTIPFDRSTLSKITIDWGDGTQSSYTDSYTLLNGNSFRRWYKKPGAYRVTFTTSFKEPGQYCDTLQEITGIVREPYVKVNLGNDTTMAEGDTLVLDAGNPGATYWWSTAETTQSIKVTTSGHYRIFMMKNGDNGGDSLWVTFKPRDSILVSRVGVDSIRCLQVAFRDSSFAPYPVASRQWDFGDGTTDTAAHPLHTYTADGAYTVKLKVVSSNGDSAVSVRSISLNTVPVADLGPDRTLNPGDSLLLDAGEPGNGPDVSYVWSTGASGATLTITTPGTYWVQAGRCGNTVSDTIRVLPSGTNLSAGFSHLTTACNTIQFKDTSKVAFGYIARWHWDFGDNTADTLQHPAHVYNGPGNYSVVFTVWDNYGQSDTDTAIVTINAPLTVNLGPDSAYWSGRAVLGQNIPGGRQYQYQWSTGDTTRTITVTQDGTYSVKVTDHFCDTTAADTIQLGILAADTLVARIGTNSIHCNLVTFRDSSIAKPAIVKWEWNFGDGTTDTLQNPLHAYSNNGQYTVRLKVTNVNGLTDSSTRSLSLFFKPVVNLGRDTTLLPQDSLLLDATKPEGSPWASFEWSTGDTTPVIRAAAPGTYRVVVNYCGNTAIDTINLQLPDSLPYTGLLAGFSGFKTACATVQFRDTSRLSASFITKWQWDFGDGTTDTLQHPLHTYAGPGNYTVRLIVTDDYANRDTALGLVSINPSLIVDLGPDSTQWSGYAVLGYNIPDRPDYKYQWSTGDTTRILTVTQNGSYWVKVTDRYCGTTASDTIHLGTAGADTLIAQIGIDSIRCNLVAFRDSSIAKPAVVKWEWAFGDGTTDTLQNPQHIYVNNGEYTVRLKVTNANGLTDSTSRLLSVYNKPLVDLGPDTTLLPGDSLILNASMPQGSPWASYYWSTGQTTPVIKAAAPATYHVVVSYCGSSVADTIHLSVKDTITYTGLKARFRVVKTDCSTLQFNESSEVLVGHITRWQWDFGDHTSDTAQHPLPHTYTKPGSYTIKLTVTDNYGNQDSVQEYVSLMLPLFVDFGRDTIYWNQPGELGYNMPQGPDYKYLWSTGDTTMFISVAQSGKYWVKVTDRYCDTTASDTVQIIITRTGTLIPHIGIDSIRYNLVAFRDSSVAIPAVIKWEWNFGDGTTDTLKNPLHTYASGGQYTVMLKVTNGYGHTDSTTRTLSIALPVADIGTVTTVNSNELLTVGAQFNHAFNSNNLFTVQLLRETSTGGRITEEGEVFDIAVIPGTNANVALSVKIPDTIPCSKDYRVRVISSAPADTVEWSSKFEIVNMPVATIQQRGDSLFTGKALACQWYLDNAALSGAIMPYYQARANGRYHVVLNNGGTCRSTSLPVNVSITAVPDVNAVVAAVKAFPNPSSGLVYIRFEKPLLKPVTLTVYDTRGNQVYSRLVKDQADQIDLSVLPKGVYYLEITGYEKQRAMRIILQ
jgi:PKD repeat protein